MNKKDVCHIVKSKKYKANYGKHLPDEKNQVRANFFTVICICMMAKCLQNINHFSSQPITGLIRHGSHQFMPSPNRVFPALISKYYVSCN